MKLLDNSTFDNKNYEEMIPAPKLRETVPGYYKLSSSPIGQQANTLISFFGIILNL